MCISYCFLVGIVSADTQRNNRKRFRCHELFSTFFIFADLSMVAARVLLGKILVDKAIFALFLKII